MDVRRLEYFAAAAESGSISRAAGIVGTTQPALTRQIRTLERKVGATLLRRSSRGVQTTAAGEALLQHYRRIATELARVPEVVQAAQVGKEIVRVGLPPGLPSTWFFGVLTRLQENHPEIELDLADLASPEQEKALMRSALDLAFMHHAPAGFRSTHVLRQPLGVALRPSTPRFSEARHLGDLDDARILAHTSWEISGQVDDLERATSAAAVTIHWRFRKFTEHVGLVASSTGADGILLSEASAAQFVYPWTWIPVEIAPGTPLTLDTFAVHAVPTMLGVEAVVKVAASVPADWSPSSFGGRRTATNSTRGVGL